MSAFEDFRNQIQNDLHSAIFGTTNSSNQLANYSFEDIQKLLNDYSEKMTNAQHKENEFWFNKTNEYNTQMANTQYQRMVQDLESAGLNKVLAYNNSPNNLVQASVPSSARGSDLNSFMGSLLSSTNSANTSTKNTLINNIFDLVSELMKNVFSTKQKFLPNIFNK